MELRKPGTRPSTRPGWNIRIHGYRIDESGCRLRNCPSVGPNLTFGVLCVIVHSVIQFSVHFRAGASLFEQMVYSAKKAMVSGQLRPGDTFPSVRALSKELKVNPNTAAKVVAHLVNEGLLETRPGIGTVVAGLPEPPARERTQLLGHEIESVVVEAKRLGIGLDEMLKAFTDHWGRLTETHPRKDGGRETR